MDRSGLEAALGHEFNDKNLLDLALIHRSFVAENAGDNDNERLEFLGDAVLQLAVTDRIYRDYPDMPEGLLAKVRAAVVNEGALAKVARRIGLGEYLVLGRGEESTGGRDKDSILSDALEAVFGAVYLDAGDRGAQNIVLKHLADDIRERSEVPGGGDYKTRLQELTAARNVRPAYDVAASGPDHNKVFEAEVSINGRILGLGTGPSKKAAEQAAAAEALDRLETV